MLQKYIIYMIGSTQTIIGLTGVGSKMLKDPPQK